jgi:hypothetical protein
MLPTHSMPIAGKYLSVPYRNRELYLSANYHSGKYFCGNLSQQGKFYQQYIIYQQPNIPGDKLNL